MNKVCLCGGNWEWVKKRLDSEWGLKPLVIPFDIDTPSEINGWIWTYVCNEPCVDIENDYSEDLVALFPGSGTSSSSSCAIQCKTCPPTPTNCPCGTEKVVLGPPACEDSCTGPIHNSTISCDFCIRFEKCSSSSSSKSSSSSSKSSSSSSKSSSSSSCVCSYPVGGVCKDQLSARAECDALNIPLAKECGWGCACSGVEANNNLCKQTSNCSEKQCPPKTGYFAKTTGKTCCKKKMWGSICSWGKQCVYPALCCDQQSSSSSSKPKKHCRQCGSEQGQPHHPDCPTKYLNPKDPRIYS